MDPTLAFEPSGSLTAWLGRVASAGRQQDRRWGIIATLLGELAGEPVRDDGPEPPIRSSSLPLNVPSFAVTSAAGTPVGEVLSGSEGVQA